MDNLVLKQNLTSKQLSLVTSELDQRKKNPAIMYALWLFLGIVGAHRFYLGDWVRGLLMLCTFGGFIVWALVDVFFIGGRLQEKNQQLERELINRVKLSTLVETEGNTRTIKDVPSAKKLY